MNNDREDEDAAKEEDEGEGEDEGEDEDEERELASAPLAPTGRPSHPMSKRSERNAHFTHYSA